MKNRKKYRVIAVKILEKYGRENYLLSKIMAILADSDYSQYGLAKTICYVLDLNFKKEKHSLLDIIDFD